MIQTHVKKSGAITADTTCSFFFSSAHFGRLAKGGSVLVTDESLAGTESGGSFSGGTDDAGMEN